MVSTSYTDQRTPAALCNRASETQCVSRTMCRGTSSRSDGGYSLVCNHISIPVASELNTLAPHAPGRLVQPALRPAPVWRCAAPATPLGVANHAERAHTLPVCAAKPHHMRFAPLPSDEQPSDGATNRDKTRS